MSTLDEHVIKLSKKKLVLFILGSCLLVAVGYWMTQLSPSDMDEENIWIEIPWFVHGVGVAMMLFFTFGGALIIKKLVDNKPGMVLNAKGIYDNASGVSAGFIPWSEIKGLSVFEVDSLNKQLLIEVAFPEKYIEVGNPLLRAINRSNYKMTGHAIAITPSALNGSFEEVIDVCNRYFAKYGGQKKPGSTLLDS